MALDAVDRGLFARPFAQVALGIIHAYTESELSYGHDAQVERWLVEGE